VYTHSWIFEIESKKINLDFDSQIDISAHQNDISPANRNCNICWNIRKPWIFYGLHPLTPKLYRMFQKERSVFWEVTVSVILSKKKMYMYMCHIPNGFRDRAISLYSSKIVDKKEILSTVSNIGVYCSSDKVDTVYIFQNSTVNINALCNSCEDMACCSSVQCTVYRTVK
jgi:hypothetical protein